MRHVNFFMFFALGQKRTCIYLVNVGELQRVVRNILQQMSYVLSDCITSYDKRKIDEMLQYYESKGCIVEKLNEVM